jgi:putative hemolysin
MADSNYGFRFLLVALIVAANGFFAAAEVSLLSSRRSRLQQLADDGDLGARAALELLSNPQRLLSVVQVAVTLCSLALGWVGEETFHQLFISWFQPLITPITEKIFTVLAFILSFAIMTYMHVVLGEVVPKNLAIETADRFAVLVAPILLVFGRLTSPLVNIIERSSTRISHKLGLKGDSESAGHSVEELKFIVSSSRSVGEIMHFEEAAIQKLLSLQDYSAREIMVPRNQMVAVRSDAPLDHILHLINEHQYSRIPVYETSSDQITGVVHLKDLIQIWTERRTLREASRPVASFDLRSILRPPIFVPETKSLRELIDEFRAHSTHIALVVDEHGTTTCLVTLEDVLEQVFGEIEDEHDITHPAPNADESILELDGATNLPDLSNQYGIDLPTEAGFETLAGFLLSKLGYIPDAGVTIESEGRRFTVLEMERNRIARVRIETLPEPEPAPEPSESSVQP